MSPHPSYRGLEGHVVSLMPRVPASGGSTGLNQPELVLDRLGEGPVRTNCVGQQEGNISLGNLSLGNLSGLPQLNELSRGLQLDGHRCQGRREQSYQDTD